MFWQKVVTTIVLIFFLVEVYEPSSNFVREGVYSPVSYSQSHDSPKQHPAERTQLLKPTQFDLNSVSTNLLDSVAYDASMVSHSCTGAFGVWIDLSPKLLAEEIFIPNFKTVRIAFTPLTPPPLLFLLT